MKTILTAILFLSVTICSAQTKPKKPIRTNGNGGTTYVSLNLKLFKGFKKVK